MWGRTVISPVGDCDCPFASNGSATSLTTTILAVCGFWLADAVITTLNVMSAVTVPVILYSLDDKEPSVVSVTTEIVPPLPAAVITLVASISLNV